MLYTTRCIITVNDARLPHSFFFWSRYKLEFKHHLKHLSSLPYSIKMSHSQIISSILSLDPFDWPSASLAAVEAERTKDIDSAQQLQLLISRVFTDLAAKEQRIASIFAKDPILDPDEIAFSIFRIERLAKLFTSVSSSPGFGNISTP